MTTEGADNRFAKAVAKALYPPSSDPEHDDVDMLWSVISDTEKARCKNVADAVLLELRDATAEMLEAGDDELRQIINSLKNRNNGRATREFPMTSVFRTMVDAARSNL
jgi:hypothetical protein